MKKNGEVQEGKPFENKLVIFILKRHLGMCSYVHVEAKYRFKRAVL